MPLRLLEATLARPDLARVPEVLADAPAVHLWTEARDDGTGTVRVLLEAEDTEGVSDRLVQAFGQGEGFRILLMAVEATVPAAELPEEPPAGAEAEGAREAPRRIGREELYEDIAHASQVTRVYAVMVALSTVVAAVGLVRGDVAIIVGAMVIAPLLGPNVALALACTLGDLDLARRSLRAIAVGVATALAASAAFGAVLGVDPLAPELAARTTAGLGDIVLALAAGAAGSLAFTSGVPAVLVGVMVAVALLPPLVAAGLLAGAGYGRPALGALALVATNVACVNLAAVATFLVQRVRPRTWWEADRARRATRIAVASWLLLLAVLAGLIAFGHVRPV